MQEKTDCCTGCAAGGPRICASSLYRSAPILGVIHDEYSRWMLLARGKLSQRLGLCMTKWKGFSVMGKIRPVGDRVVGKAVAIFFM